jgi:TRAP-type C4-dicarboxylate transport system permease small subunit
VSAADATDGGEAKAPPAMPAPGHLDAAEPASDASVDATHTPPGHAPASITLALACTALAAMAAVAFGDVAMRVLARPITGAYELTSLLVALVVYAGLPDVTWRDEHVRAGLFTGWIARRARLDAALRALRRTATTTTFALLAFAMANYAWRLAAAGDRAPFIELPLAWVVGLGAVLLALASWLAWRARQPERAAS